MAKTRKPTAKKVAAKKSAVKAAKKPAKKTARPAAKSVHKSPAKSAVAKKVVGKKVVAKKTAAARRKVPKKVASKPALKDGRAPDSPWLIPTLTVRTAEAAIAFLKSAFGFGVDFTMPGEDGRIGYAQLRHREALVHLSPEGSFGATTKAPKSSGAESPAMLYVYCEDVDALTARARAAGAVVFSEPADMFWGDRVASFVDPDGYRWAFATNVGAFDPAKAPG